MVRSTSPRRPSRSDDIARLLDPAYSSASFSSTAGAYVDTHGELHDPDYRHFPVSRPKRRHSNPHSIPLRRWDTFDEEDDQDEQPSHSKQRPSYVPTIVIPHSYDSYDTVLDLDAYDDDEAFVAPRSSGGGPVSRIFSRKRRSLDGASSHTSQSQSPYYTPTLLTDTPTTTATAIDEDDDNDAASHHHPTQLLSSSHSTSNSRPASFTFTPIYPSSSTRSHRHHHRHRHTSYAAVERSRPQQEGGGEEEQEELHREQEEEEYVPSRSLPHSHSHSHDDQPWTPTCTQALKRQWQAISLSVRFGVFRAQRRIRSRLAML